jgi:hypothetical protein
VLVTALRAHKKRRELLSDEQPSGQGSIDDSEVTEDEAKLVAYLYLG